MRLTCAFGSRWTAKGCGPCKKCLAQLERDVAQFWRDVFFGIYDADGYTPAERKMQQRKAKQVA